MPVAGHPGQHVLQQFYQLVLNFIKKKHAGCTSPSDGIVLKMHYKWSFWFLLFIYTVVWYAWYHSELLICANKFNSEAAIKHDYINFCSSYVYVWDENGTRRYLFFYKWLHLVGLFLAFVCYIPRKLCKSFENPRALALFNELYHHRSKYDVNTERTILQRVSQYIKTNLLTHNSIYYNALGCNLVALVIDCFLWLFIDFILNNRFINLGWMSVPFNRDPVQYTDFISQTFPPFSECNIDQRHELLSNRSELFGCHLVLMEFYEKVFLALWVWLLFLTTATVLYTIFLLLLHIPYFRFLVIRVDKPDFAEDDVEFDDSKNLMEKLFIHVVDKCKIGDIWLLYKLKRNLSPHRYYMLLWELAEHSLNDLSCQDPTVLPSAKEVYPQLMQQVPAMQNHYNNVNVQHQFAQQFQQGLPGAGRRGKR